MVAGICYFHLQQTWIQSKDRMFFVYKENESIQ